VSWEWWHIPVISPLRSLRQEDSKFKASLGHIERLCLKKKKKPKKQNKTKRKKNTWENKRQNPKYQ
jgi:hypothetical protein